MIKKIEARTARVEVVRLRYAGLPLANEFAKAGFCVIGIHLDESKLSVNGGRSYIRDVRRQRSPEKLNREIDGSDCVVVVTDHIGVDYESHRAPRVRSCRHPKWLRGIESENIIRL